MKKIIGDIIWGKDLRFGHTFDYVMIVIIVISVIAMSIETLPTIAEDWGERFDFLNWLVIFLFSVEYVLRIWTAPKKWAYIFSFWGLIDLLAVLPFWTSLTIGLPAGETLWTLRILRLAKLLRFVANMERMQRVFELVWRDMLVFLMLACLVMFCTSVGIYNFEHEAQPEAFPSIPHSFWFAVTSLTTVGYGDIYPITAAGKFFTFLILMIGLGIVAMPAGLISAAFIQASAEEAQRKLINTTKDKQTNPKI